MADLIKRVSEAPGPDRELDALIFCHLQGVEFVSIGENAGGHETFQWRGELLNPDWLGAPRLTASLDRAVHVVERALPGWSWSVRKSGFGNPADAELWNPRHRPGEGNSIRAVNDTGSAPLALLAALLTALEAQAGGGA